MGELAVGTIHMKGDVLITAIVTSNSILILALTVLFIRERSRRKALEELLRQSINYWRGAYEASESNRAVGADCNAVHRMR
jgi:hypothetical protein